MAKMITHDQHCQMCLLRDQGHAQKRLLDFESGRRHCPGLSRLQQDRYRPQHSTSRRSVFSFREAVNLLDRKLDAFNGTTLNGTLPNFGDEVLLLLAYETSFRQPSWELRPKLTQLNSHGPTKNSPASEVVQNSMTRRKRFADKSGWIRKANGDDSVQRKALTQDHLATSTNDQRQVPLERISSYEFTDGQSIHHASSQSLGTPASASLMSAHDPVQAAIEARRPSIREDAVSRPSAHTGDRGELYSQDMHPQLPRQNSCHGQVQRAK